MKQLRQDQLLPPDVKHLWDGQSPESKLFKAVTKYFEDYGLSGQIEMINSIKMDLLDPDPEEGSTLPDVRSMKYAQREAFYLGEISNLLAKMYEITHRYHYSEFSRG